MSCDYQQSDWAAAKVEARAVMISAAKIRGMITYSDLAKQISSLKFQAHDPCFFQLIGEISEDEGAAGNGMLSVLVVHKDGDM